MLRIFKNVSKISALISRALSTTKLVSHGDFEWEPAKRPEDVVNVTYIDRHDIRHEIKGKVGDNLMFLAHRHDLDIEGACESALVS